MGKDFRALPIGVPASQPPVRGLPLADTREHYPPIAANNTAAAKAHAELREDAENTCSRPSSVDRMVDSFTRDTWEIRLLRGVKSAIARGASKQAFELLTELVLGGGVGQVCVDDPKMNQRWQKDLAEKSNFVAMLNGIDCNLISVDAFDLARIDGLLHQIETRREDGVRKIAMHSTQEAARLRDIIRTELLT